MVLYDNDTMTMVTLTLLRCASFLFSWYCSKNSSRLSPPERKASVICSLSSSTCSGVQDEDKLLESQIWDPPPGWLPLREPAKCQGWRCPALCPNLLSAHEPAVSVYLIFIQPLCWIFVLLTSSPSCWAVRYFSCSLAFASRTTGSCSQVLLKLDRYSPAVPVWL